MLLRPLLLSLAGPTFAKEEEEAKAAAPSANGSWWSVLLRRGVTDRLRLRDGARRRARMAAALEPRSRRTVVMAIFSEASRYRLQRTTAKRRTNGRRERRRRNAACRRIAAVALMAVALSEAMAMISEDIAPARSAVRRQTARWDRKRAWTKARAW